MDVQVIISATVRIPDTATFVRGNDNEIIGFESDGKRFAFWLDVEMDEQELPAKDYAKHGIAIIEYHDHAIDSDSPIHADPA